MAIYGLESDYYCAHTPIPVSVSPLRPEWNNMEMLIYNDIDPLIIARMYKLNSRYYIDLSPWVKTFMHELKDTRVYYKPGVIETINEQVTHMTIMFAERDPNGFDPHDEFQTIEKNFVQCALYTQPFLHSYGKNIKLWKGYPYSWHYFPAMNQTLYTIVDSTSTPAVGDYVIEYETKVCKGSYLKWLNEYGSYYYWWFGNGREESSEGDNIFDVPRGIFNTIDKSSNYDTVGFNGTNKLTLRDRIQNKYWHLFVSLATSPEVYILKDGWIDTYLGGATSMGPEWWIKIRQSDFSFNRILQKNSMTEIEIELEYPKPYSQKRI